MAELLKKEYGLLALKVQLDISRGESVVTFELEGGDPGRRDTEMSPVTYPANQLGIPDRIERHRTLYHGYDFQLPADLITRLQDTWQNEDVAERPLWLHLVKPYGYLGTIPWERLLRSALRLPELCILRIPDFLIRPPDPKPTLNIILCASSPAAKGPIPLGHLLNRTIELLLETLANTRITIHVFTDNFDFIHDELTYDDLRARWAASGMLGNEIILHDPVEAEKYTTPEATTKISSSPEQIENPWLLWMRDAMQGSAVDVVHFISHGYLSRDQGALAVAESPLVNVDRRIARFIGTHELSVFLNQLGAWSTVFTSPEGNYSEMGLRMVADTIAQVRPGSMTYHEVGLDRDFSALASVYKFHYSTDDSPPPCSDALFMYCHPSLLTKSSETRDEITPAAISSKIYNKEERVPAWVAAAERWLEMQNLELKSVIDLSEEFLGQQESYAYQVRLDKARDAQKTLQRIQEIVARNAREIKG